MGQLWSLVSILNSGALWPENQNCPCRPMVNFRHVTSRNLRVKKPRRVCAFYGSPVTVVGTIRNLAVPLESIALSSLLSSTSTTPFSNFSDVCLSVWRSMKSLAGHKYRRSQIWNRCQGAYACAYRISRMVLAGPTRAHTCCYVTSS